MTPLPAPGGIKGDATADTTAVLLAAGAGTRLGRGPKALLPFRGRTLVEVLADVLLDGGCREAVVILGAGAEWVRKVPGLQPHSLVENPDWQTGMGSSFKLGLTTARPQDHVLVALVDQPGLTPETVGLLLKAHTPGRVTAAAYRNDSYSEGLGSGGTGAEGGPGNVRRGHPLLLDATLRAKAAASATGDAGARFFLQAHPELIDLVDCTPASGQASPAGKTSTPRTSCTCLASTCLTRAAALPSSEVSEDRLSLGMTSVAPRLLPCLWMSGPRTFRLPRWVSSQRTRQSGRRHPSSS